MISVVDSFIVPQQCGGSGSNSQWFFPSNRNSRQQQQQQHLFGRNNHMFMSNTPHFINHLDDIDDDKDDDNDKLTPHPPEEAPPLSTVQLAQKTKPIAAIGNEIISDEIKKAADVVSDTLINEVVNPLLSSDIERGVPREAIKGAALTAVTLSILTGQGLAATGVAGLGAAFVAISPGLGGKAFRSIGGAAWESAQAVAALSEKYGTGRKLSQTAEQVLDNTLNALLKDERKLQQQQEEEAAARKLEEEQMAAKAKAEEEARRAAEAKAAEEARRRAEEEAKAAEEARLAAEAKAAEEKRRAEAEVKAAEEARLAAQAKAAEEKRRAEAEAKAAEEERLAAEAKAAEEKRRAEAEAKAAEEARLAAEQARRKEEERKAEEAELAKEEAEKTRLAQEMKREQEERQREETRKQEEARKSEKTRFKEDMEVEKDDDLKETIRLAEQILDGTIAGLDDAIADTNAKEEWDSAGLLAKELGKGPSTQDEAQEEEDVDALSDEEDMEALAQAARDAVEKFEAEMKMQDATKAKQRELWDSEMVTDEDFEYDEDLEEQREEYDAEEDEDLEELEDLLGDEELDDSDFDEYVEALDTSDVDLEELGRAARAAVEEFESGTKRTNEQQDSSIGTTTHDDSAIMTDWSKLTVAQLRDELRSRGLRTTGKKAELVATLSSDDMDKQILEEETGEGILWDSELLEEPTMEDIEETPQDIPNFDQDLARQAREAVAIFEQEQNVDYEAMTVNELKDELRNRGLKISGRKADLVERLRSSA